MKIFKKFNYLLVLSVLLANLSNLSITQSQTSKASKMLSPEDKKGSLSAGDIAGIATAAAILIGALVVGFLYKIKNQPKTGSQEASSRLSAQEQQDIEDGYNTSIIDLKNEAAKDNISAQQVDAMIGSKIPKKEDVVDFTISAKKVYVASKVNQQQITDLVKNINDWSAKYGVPKETYYESITQPSLKEARSTKKAAIFTPETQAKIRQELKIYEFDPNPEVSLANRIERLFKEKGINIFSDNSSAKTDFQDSLENSIKNADEKDFNTLREQLIKESAGKIDVREIDSIFKTNPKLNELLPKKSVNLAVGLSTDIPAELGQISQISAEGQYQENSGSSALQSESDLSTENLTDLSGEFRQQSFSNEAEGLSSTPLVAE